MGNFLYGGKKPASIKYNGVAVQVVKYNGVVVWQAMDSYVITGKLIGEGVRHSWDCNCETDDCHLANKIVIVIARTVKMTINIVCN